MALNLTPRVCPYMGLSFAYYTRSDELIDVWAVCGDNPEQIKVGVLKRQGKKIVPGYSDQGPWGNGEESPAHATATLVTARLRGRRAPVRGRGNLRARAEPPGKKVEPIDY